MSQKNIKNNPTLMALTASALALPGISEKVQADAAPDKYEFGFAFSKYQEDDIPENRVAPGDTVERYDIDVTQFHLLAPINSQLSLTIESSFESMSGASPQSQFINENNANQTVVSMSGATITEDRTDFLIAPRYYLENGSISGSVYLSDENDYDSWAYGVSGEVHLFDKMTTLTGSFSYSSDDINSTQFDGGSFRATGEEKTSTSFFAGVSQIIDQNTVMQFGLSLTEKEGFLSDPYKPGDVRPDERSMTAVNIGVRRYLSHADAALHGDYRYYTDDWGINSHTIGISYYQNLRPSYSSLTNKSNKVEKKVSSLDNSSLYFQLIPSFRYYAQSEADFFDLDPAVPPEGTYDSSDARLAGFGAYTFGLKFVAHVWNFSFSGAYERYISDTEYGFNGLGVSKTEEEVPATVNYNRFTFGFNARW